MYIPPVRSDTHKRMLILHVLGRATFDQWHEAGGKLALYVSRFHAWCDNHVEMGGLLLVDGVYSLAPYMTKYFNSLVPEEASKQEVVPSRTAPEWKPLSMKHVPSMHARRHDADQSPERNHFSGSAGEFPVLIRGVRVMA